MELEVNVAEGTFRVRGLRNEKYALVGQTGKDGFILLGKTATRDKAHQLLRDMRPSISGDVHVVYTNQHIRFK